MRKIIEKNFYYIALSTLLIAFIILSLIASVEISLRDEMITKLTNDYNNLVGENIALKGRIDYEIEQKEIQYRMINEKVELLNLALSKIYPGYDYRKKINNAFLDNSIIELLPESLIEVYIEQKMLIPHGLNNYTKTLPDIIWPVNPDISYVATKQSEYGTRRPYSYMKYKHEGLDMNSPYSDEILAIHSGIIHRIYYDEGGGWSIELKFQIREKYYFSRIRHIEKIYVKKGDYVEQGQLIASAGNTGIYSYGKHIHFELWEWNGSWYRNINPVLNSTWGNRVITSIK
jgi:murein DD-endopeptidase MepM/ murein hydrolase activator NlpD